MAGELTLTICGNAVADPELRFTSSGAALCNFTVAKTERKYNKATSEWEDGDKVFLRCTAWRDLGEHIAESVTRGTALVVVGNLKQRTYETKEGEKRTVTELEVSDIGPSLRNATARVEKAQRGGNGKAPQGQGAAWGQNAPQADPWASQAGYGAPEAPAAAQKPQGGRKAPTPVQATMVDGPGYVDPPF